MVPSFLLLTAALITVCQCGTFSNASVVAYRLQVSAGTARAFCATLGGSLAMTHTRGYLSVVTQTTATSVNSAAPSFAVRLGAARTVDLWQWTSPPFQTTPLSFSRAAQCLTAVCVWAQGFPTSDGDCLALANSMWRNFICTAAEAFACEVPYSSTYRCVVGNSFDTPAAAAYCSQRGWWLATFPNYASADAAYNDPSCAGLRALDFEYTLASMDDLKGPSRDFRWTRGPLGFESGGLGRLLSRGQPGDPTGVQRFGFDGPDWDTRNPEPNNYGSNERCGNLYVNVRAINDWACDRTTGSFICEIPDVVRVPVSSPCFPGVPAGSVVQVDSERTLTGCTVSNKLIVTATLRASRVVFVNTTIVVFGTAAAAITLDIAASEMTNCAIAVTGTLSSSTVSILTTRITSTARVDAMQPADTMAFITVNDVTLQQRARIVMTGNLVKMSQGSNINLIHVASPISSLTSSIELIDNQIEITATQSATVLRGSSGSSFRAGGGITIRKNTITVTAGGAAAMWTEGAITINAAAEVSTNTVRLTGQSAILSSLGTVDLTGGTLSWGGNVAIFAGASTIIAATINAAAGTEVTIANELFTGTATATLLSAMTGDGVLTLQCNSLFEQVLETPDQYVNHIPSVRNTKYIPCYTGPTTPTPPPSPTTFFEGLSVAGVEATATANVKLITVAAAFCGVALIIIFIIIIVAVRQRSASVSGVQKVRSSSSKRSSSRSSKRGKENSSFISGQSGTAAGSSATGADGSYAGGSSYTGADGSYAGGSSYTGADGSDAGGSSYTGADGSDAGGSSYAY